MLPYNKPPCPPVISIDRAGVTPIFSSSIARSENFTGYSIPFNRAGAAISTFLLNGVTAPGVLLKIRRYPFKSIHVKALFAYIKN